MAFWVICSFAPRGLAALFLKIRSVASCLSGSARLCSFIQTVHGANCTQAFSPWAENTALTGKYFYNSNLVETPHKKIQRETTTLCSQYCPKSAKINIRGRGDVTNIMESFLNRFCQQKFLESRVRVVEVIYPKAPTRFLIHLQKPKCTQTPLPCCFSLS